MTLYFAYGSNLNLSQMADRCPGAKAVGPMKLDDWLLVFRGVADIIPSPGSKVSGAVWKLTPACEARLDQYEGCRPDGRGMYRKEYIAIAPFEFDGVVHEELLIYVMNSDGIMPPSKYYLDVIKQGFRDFRLKMKPLNDAVEAAHDKKAPSHIERQRLARTGRPAFAPRPSEVRKEPTKEQLSAQRQAAKAADEASRKLKRKHQETKLDLDLFRRAMVTYGD